MVVANCRARNRLVEGVGITNADYITQPRVNENRPSTVPEWPRCLMDTSRRQGV